MISMFRADDVQVFAFAKNLFLLSCLGWSRTWGEEHFGNGYGTQDHEIT